MPSVLYNKVDGRRRTEMNKGDRKARIRTGRVIARSSI